MQKNNCENYPLRSEGTKPSRCLWGVWPLPRTAKVGKAFFTIRLRLFFPFLITEIVYVITDKYKNGYKHFFNHSYFHHPEIAHGNVVFIILSVFLHVHVNMYCLVKQIPDHTVLFYNLLFPLNKILASHVSRYPSMYTTVVSIPLYFTVIYFNNPLLDCPQFLINSVIQRASCAYVCICIPDYFLGIHSYKWDGRV